MGAIQLEGLELLADDELYTRFALADDNHEGEVARAAMIEILRRAELPVNTVHNVPKSLARWLPRVFWHQRPEGEGRG